MAVTRLPLNSPAHISSGRRQLFVVGVLPALAAFGVTLLLGSFMVLRSQQIVGGESIVVASRDIQARESLNSGAVEIVSYPSNLAPAGALTSLSAAYGNFALTNISKGEPLTAAMVSSQPEVAPQVGQEYLPIPAGYVAFTIPTSEQEGVGGYVAPGDYLDVIATVNTSVFGVTSPKTVTKTVFTNLHVIRVGPQTGTTQGTAGGVSSSLTVVVSSCDAEMWSWLLGNATLRYELRSYLNYPAASPSPAAATQPSPAAAGAAAGTSTTSGAASTANAPAATADTAAANGCAVGGTSGIGPAQVDKRFAFTKI